MLLKHATKSFYIDTYFYSFIDLYTDSQSVHHDSTESHEVLKETPWSIIWS